MSELEIIIAPDPELKKKCEPVLDFNIQVEELLDNMFVTMKRAPGIGLAGPQVGFNKRMIVVDTTQSEEEGRELKMVNPEIVWRSEENKKHEEGCLSLPGYFEYVNRPDKIIVQYLNESNKKIELEAKGLLSVVIQHEVDHLDGILFIDHISSLKRGIISRKLKKYKKSINNGKNN